MKIKKGDKLPGSELFYLDHNNDVKKIDEAIEYAFKLTDTHGIERINKSILEASIMYKIDEDVLRERINDESFILNERKNNE